MRRNDPNDPLLPLYDGLYDAAVVANLGVIDNGRATGKTTPPT